MVDFYKLAFADDTLGYIFTDVAKMDLDEHLPVIVDFWESMVLGTASYQERGRNPMLIHHQLAEKTPLLPKHFERWLELFERSVNDRFAGEKAELTNRLGYVPPNWDESPQRSVVSSMFWTWATIGSAPRSVAIVL